MGADEVVAGTGMVGALRVVFDTSMQNTEKIENFCKEQGISLLGRIPFDSDAVKAINNGQTIVDIDCASGAAVMAVYSKTMKLLFERRGRVEVMIIKTLVENTALSKKFGSEHGLSLYIEANSRKILFDVGAGDLFLENAKKLNVDIPEVDYLIISHGHYDHGGGLRAFLRVNTKTEVFLHRLAFEKYYASRLNEKLEYIGLDEELKQNRQVVLTSDRFFINRGIQVFSNINRKESPLKLNSSLFMEHDGKIAQDTFAHEQNLIIEEAGKTLLVTGCAHNGIVNILEHFHDLKGRMPDYVVGGFHLSSRSGGNEVREMIDRIGKYLVGTKAKFYTCHCTGIEPYNRLKAAMGDSIDYLSTGSEIVI